LRYSFIGKGSFKRSNKLINNYCRNQKGHNNSLQLMKEQQRSTIYRKSFRVIKKHKMNKKIILETQRLSLREFNLNDTEFIIKFEVLQ